MESVRHNWNVGFSKEKVERRGTTETEVTAEYGGKLKITWSKVDGYFTFRNLPVMIKLANKYTPPAGSGFKANVNMRIKANDVDIITEIADYFNSNFGKSRVPVRIVTSEQIDELVTIGTIVNYNKEDVARLKEAFGFINNGVIYINSGNKGVGVDTLFHELLHVVCAAMKFHKTYKTDYYKWLEAMKHHPSYDVCFKEVVKKHTNESGEQLIHGSDLKEEVLVEILSSAYKSTFEQEWNKDSSITLDAVQDRVIDILNDIFKTNIAATTNPIDLGATSLGDILIGFNSRLLKPGNSLFSKTRIPMSQQLAAIKRMMIKNGDIVYSDECY